MTKDFDSQRRMIIAGVKGDNSHAIMGLKQRLVVHVRKND